MASDAGALPGRVARALVLAATQAIANAVQHAGAAGLQVTVQARAAGIRVRIADAGGGFDPAAIPEDRLGIRGSIVARTAAVGGRARVQTTASGTVVTLEWGRRA
ncbi:ATP-binding protein [Microbacterium aurum]